MTTPTRDAELVASHLAGDPAALGGIYDRYADTLHDTAAAMLNDRSAAADVLHDVILIAAERLGQLRDPDRLKPWLFAILRNEVYRRTKQRRRTIATDFSGADDGFDMADERNDDIARDVSDELESDELAELVRGAARGLDERDQLVLELSVRQGLEGEDLADALGVSTNQSYTLVHRMRERVERSLSAFVVAKAGRQDCDTLDALLGSWDGEFTVLIRKRVARHIDKCGVCDDSRRKVAPLVLFAGAPAYAAPPGLREQILGAAALQAAAPAHPYQFTATDGFPQVVRAVRRVAAWVAPTAAASLMLVVAGLGIVFMQQRNDDASIRDAEIALETTTTTATDTADDAATVTAATTPAPTSVVVASTDDIEPGRANTPRDPSVTPPTDVPADTADVDDDDASDKPPPTQAPAPTAPPATPEPPAPPANTPTPPTSPPPANPAPSDDPAPPVDPPPNTTATPPATDPPPRPTDPPPVATDPPTPGDLRLSATSIDLGQSSTSASITITNIGDLAVPYSTSNVTGPFSVNTSSGTLDGGASITLTASIDRSNLGEGSVSGSVSVSGGTVNTTVTISASVERPPVISNVSVNGFCSAFIEVNASAAISDPAGVSSAAVSVSGPGGQAASAAMSNPNGDWFGFMSIPYSTPAEAAGTWGYTITATDTRGNFAQVSGTFVPDC